jgi:trigger factor
MDITLNKIDDLNAVLTINIGQNDYAEEIDKTLKDYKKKATMPGFRPGMVPMGMVKKMYGTSVLVEFLNKKLGETLNSYISENKLNLLGNPLPIEEEDKKFDPENQTEFEFKYELGLSPEFNVNLSDKDKFEFYKIKIDEKLIDKYTNDIQRRFGKLSSPEVSGEKDMLSGTFHELDKEGNHTEHCSHHHTTISIDHIEDKKAQKPLIGLKVGDMVKVNPSAISTSVNDMASMLGVSRREAEKIKHDYHFEVQTIHHIEEHELNQELFDKAFGTGNVKSIEEFTAKIKEQLGEMLLVDADVKLKNDIIKSLQERLKIQLPDAFMKKWLLVANEGKVTEAILEKEYEDYADSLRIQLIENQIIKENNLQIENDEMLNEAKRYFNQQMAQYGYPPADDAQLEDAAKNILSKEENARNIYQNIMDAKLLKVFKTLPSLKEKEISFDEFTKLASGKTSKGILNSINNLFN